MRVQVSCRKEKHVKRVQNNLDATVIYYCIILEFPEFKRNRSQYKITEINCFYFIIVAYIKVKLFKIAIKIIIILHCSADLLFFAVISNDTKNPKYHGSGFIAGQFFVLFFFLSIHIRNSFKLYFRIFSFQFTVFTMCIKVE